MYSTFDLSGRTAVVTGGGTHIGKAIARALASSGAHVYIVGRRTDVCELAAVELRAAGLDVLPRTCDAADEAAMESLAYDIVAETGHLDVMVANAGGPSGRERIPQISLQQWDLTLRTTLQTAFVSAQVAARAMDRTIGGRIILVGSIHGTMGSDARIYSGDMPRSSSDYHAAKGAVINLTRSLACDLGPMNINVNCISPGHIPSLNAGTAEKAALARLNPLGRVGAPEDVAGVAVMLASEAGRFVTGQNIVVDGGFSAW